MQAGRFRIGGAALGMASWLVLAAAARADVYVVTDLGSLGGAKGSGAYANNSEGVQAGYSFVAGTNFVHAMVNDHGSVLDLGTLGGTQSLARAVNRNGVVVGWAYPPGLAYQRAFVWRDGVMTDLGTFGGTQSDAHDVNDNGLIVGSSFTPEGSERAFWTIDGVLHDLGTLGGSQSRSLACNRWNDITGMALTSGDLEWHAFLGKPSGPLYDLGTLGGPASHGQAINDLVHVVGWSMIQVNNPASRGFFWADGTMKSLGTLGGIYSSAFGINNHDDVVGASTRADGTQAAFLWRNDQMIDLVTLVAPGSGWKLTSAWSIDDQGVIVGEGVRPDGRARAYLLTPSAATSVDGDTPRTLEFAGAAPNPVHGEARFSFALPAAAEVRLALFDVSGREVRRLAEGTFSPGRHDLAWDGLDASGRRAEPGAYWGRFESGGRTLVRSFVVVR